ncbi:hypothetical protein FA09DRAFT_340190 [Tilletiopsis washingtonensis]|uniref:Uncharacterized protein n=1 Tax=Tilletiopsis washingtonensis TaxID=58919 RepID=A0A316Z3R7_9BASI|nr:hypothetical protein FA09DRAFT_340190 [Tilletiopsis washingtonensis]PWN96390.1 hypothetical protein FA09DRAFT_340190 [Tilletiopsis washingtonensis]
MLRIWLSTPDAFVLPNRYGLRFHAVAQVVWEGLPRSADRIRHDIHRLKYEFFSFLVIVLEGGMRSTPYARWPYHLKSRVPCWWQVYDVHVMRTQLHHSAGTAAGTGAGVGTNFSQGSLGSPSLGSPPPYSPPANDRDVAFFSDAERDEDSDDY